MLCGASCDLCLVYIARMENNRVFIKRSGLVSTFFFILASFHSSPQRLSLLTA